jgi:hypothetical protein
MQTPIRVGHGAEISATPIATITANASNRIFRRNLSDAQLKVATLEIISSAMNAIHGATSHH